MAWDTPTTVTVGQILTAAFWNAEVKGNMDYLKGGIGSYTPQIDQGVTTNITKTVAEARYTKAGDMVDVWFVLNVTGTGTSGSNITVSLPVTATGHSFTVSVGSGLIFDASPANRYQGAWELVDFTKVAMGITQANASLVGTVPAFALASGDSLRGVLRYFAS